MSETNELAGSAEPQAGEPIVKSETISPEIPEGTAQPEPELELEAPKAEPEAKSEPEPKTKTAKPWYEDRIAKLNRKAADEARRADALQRQIDEFRAQGQPKPADGQEAAPKPQQTPVDIEQLVERRAQARVEEDRAQAAVNEFNAECNRIAQAGSKQFPDFGDAVQTLWRATDGLTADGQMTKQAVSIVEAAAETGKGHEVLHYLGKNPDEAIRIANLPSDSKRAAAIVKLANSFEPAKQVSKAPAPMTPVGGGSVRSDPDVLNTRDTARYIKMREEAWKAKGMR